MLQLHVVYLSITITLSLLYEASVEVVEVVIVISNYAKVDGHAVTVALHKTKPIFFESKTEYR